MSENPRMVMCPRCLGGGKIPFSVVRALRERMGARQVDVIKATGIGQSNYSRIESGEVAPLYQVGKLAEFFGVSSGVIMGFEPIPAPKPVRPAKAPSAKRLAASKRRRAAIARKNQKR